MTRLPTDGRWQWAGWAVALLAAAAAPLVLGPFGLYLAASILALGLFGAAFDLLYGYTGQLSIGHSVFFGVGAYAATLALRTLGGGPLVGLLAALVAGSVAAVVLGVVAVRVASHGFVIVTILLALVAHLAATTWTGLTGGTDGLTVLVPPLRLGGLSVSLVDPLGRYYFVLAVLAVSLAVLRRLAASQVGLAFRLVRENERRARAVGYNVAAYKLAAFVVSGAFAALAGALSTYVAGFVSADDFALVVSGDPIIYTLVGGRATLVGAVLGAALVEGSANAVSELTDAYPLFVGALLVAVVVLEPEGLLGLARRVRDAVRDRIADGEGSADE
ncbi:MAG: branched-chain amino acid ABC transporter permease [Haloarculaceae archaeon]